MDNMSIKHSRTHDLEAISNIYKKTIDYLHRPEHILYANWNHGIYPTTESANEFMARNELFTVYVDDEVAGCFALNSKGAPEYSEIDWGINIQDNECIMLHTLAIDPDKMNCGLGKMVMAFIEGYAKSNGYKAIRLDTSGGNIPANKLYSGMGYHLVTSRLLEPEYRANRIYNCYQKILVK